MSSRRFRAVAGVSAGAGTERRFSADSAASAPTIDVCRVQDGQVTTLAASSSSTNGPVANVDSFDSLGSRTSEAPSLSTGERHSHQCGWLVLGLGIRSPAPVAASDWAQHGSVNRENQGQNQDANPGIRRCINPGFWRPRGAPVRCKKVRCLDRYLSCSEKQEDT
jgi:hypothetical protein